MDVVDTGDTAGSETDSLMGPGRDEDAADKVPEAIPMDTIYRKVFEENMAKEKLLKDQALQQQHQQQALQQQQQQQQALLHQQQHQQGALLQQQPGPNQVYQQQFRAFQLNLQGNTGAPPLQQPQVLATPPGAPPAKKQRLSGGLFPNLNVPSGFGAIGADLTQPRTSYTSPPAAVLTSPANNTSGPGASDPSFAQRVFEFLVSSGMEEGPAMVAAVNIASGQQQQQVQPPQRQQPSSLEAWMKEFIETQGAINKTIATGLTGQQGGRDQETGDPAELDMYKFKEPNMSDPQNGLFGTFELQDNSTDSFSWTARLALKAPNAMPASYWKSIPGNGAQLTTPRRATSLVLTHLAGSAQINPAAVLACHDRAYPITYQVSCLTLE